ncbi:hypothetical protein [Azospirillum halopraeferens]|uniref:hypothetical protein n=1 Tax=Azospirillum halopraeferens TaxID=34010 RepID=UPI000427C61F|nr:hypothetical protein [Azospirillum halopraeferens]
MRSLHNHDDAMGTPVPAVDPSSHRLAVVLTAGGSRTVAVPAGARFVLINATGPLWVQYGAAATVPAADITNGTAPELNPAARWIEGITTLGLAAPGACAASLAFYR